MRRVWYWPAWTLTDPWKIRVWRSGDEFLRRTSCLSLGLLGTFIYAHEDDEWYDTMWELTQAHLAREEAAGD